MTNLEKSLYDFMILMRKEDIKLEDECIEPIEFQWTDYILIHCVPNLTVNLSNYNPTAYCIHIDDVSACFSNYNEAMDFLNEYYEDITNSKFDIYREWYQSK